MESRSYKKRLIKLDLELNEMLLKRSKADRDRKKTGRLLRELLTRKSEIKNLDNKDKDHIKNIISSQKRREDRILEINSEIRSIEDQKRELLLAKEKAETQEVALSIESLENQIKIIRENAPTIEKGDLQLIIYDSEETESLLFKLTDDFFQDFTSMYPYIKFGIYTKDRLDLVRRFGDLLKKFKFDLVEYPWLKRALQTNNPQIKIITRGLVSEGHPLTKIWWEDIQRRKYNDASNFSKNIAMLIDPLKHLLMLEAAVVSQPFDVTQICKEEIGKITVMFLGRYIASKYHSETNPIACLSKELVLAKSSGYPQLFLNVLSLLLEKLLKKTVITAIPDKKGRFQRAEKLLRELKIRSDLSHLTFTKSLLNYSSESAEMKEMNKSDRIKHINASLNCEKKYDLSGKDLVVIDDICTTGATFKRAYECLKSAGAKSIQFIALARTIS